MSTFKEANQVRASLKMKLANFAWYNSSSVLSDADGYCVVISVKHVDNLVRKTIPPVINGVSVKTEIDSK